MKANVARENVVTAEPISPPRTASSLAPVLRGGFQLKEAAEYLGLSPITVKRLVWRGLLKPNRAVRHLLFSVKELNRFLEGQ